jgi:hypothetical protein
VPTIPDIVATINRFARDGAHYEVHEVGVRNAAVG